MDTQTFDAVFWSFFITSTIGFLLGLTKMAYKSKCKEVSCCCIKIIRDVEKSEHSISKNIEDRELLDDKRILTNAICSNACFVAKQTKAKAIITVTYSGFNTIKISSYRPNAFIYAFTNNHTILNTLSLIWGVRGFYYDRGTTTDQTIKETKEILRELKFLKKGDLVVNLASMPAQEKGMTNMMKLSKVK